MHATVKLEKYPVITNPQPVAIRMIGEFLDALAIRKINQRLNFSKNSFAHRGSFDFLNLLKESLKKVASEDQTRRNPVRKRSLRKVNEHFELDFNAGWPSAAVFQRFLSALGFQSISFTFMIISLK